MSPETREASDADRAIVQAWLERPWGRQSFFEVLCELVAAGRGDGVAAERDRAEKVAMSLRDNRPPIGCRDPQLAWNLALDQFRWAFRKETP